MHELPRYEMVTAEHEDIEVSKAEVREKRWRHIQKPGRTGEVFEFLVRVFSQDCERGYFLAVVDITPVEYDVYEKGEIIFVTSFDKKRHPTIITDITGEGIKPYGGF